MDIKEIRPISQLTLSRIFPWRPKTIRVGVYYGEEILPAFIEKIRQEIKYQQLINAPKPFQSKMFERVILGEWS